MAEAQLHVRQVRSGIGSKPKHRGTLRALGLGRIGRTRVLPDRPEIRGMVARVTHLVEVSSDGAGTPPPPVPARPSARAKAATKAKAAAEEKAALKTQKVPK
jgi:large subunit ribosomal protein L30